MCLVSVWSQCINVVIEGKVSFNNRSLHAIGDTPNPYEKAISIIGKTLAPFDDDNLIPCFGFGDGKRYDPLQVQVKSCYYFHILSELSTGLFIYFICLLTATTHDQEVFSFHDDHTPCHGFEEVLACYRNIVPNLRLAGWHFPFNLSRKPYLIWKKT